jgi:HEPN domain-containing protein
MPAANPLIVVVRGWVSKAENDLKTATHTLKLGRECPTDTVSFHAQQCAEKYLKALLVYHGTGFSKVRDIERLVRLLPHGVLAGWALSEQRRLTAYAVITRYPGAYPPISLAEARTAVKIAHRVRREIRRLLPGAALRRSR